MTARRQPADRTEQLVSQLEKRERFEGLVGSSVKMRAVFELVESVSRSAACVLIEGESGTGKELVARAIHYRSPRGDKPFVVVSCSALSETALFETADGGTLFLDEVAAIPLSTQAKILHVLSEGEVEHGLSKERAAVDVRIVAATNADLADLITKGTFREDLYQRLHVISVRLPPLRDRREDVPALAYHFLKKYNARMGKGVDRVSPEAMALLQGYRWVGNVRELENVMERAVVLEHGDAITPASLPAHITRGSPAGIVESDSLADLPYKEAKRRALLAFEKRYLATLLEKSAGNVSQASRAAGLDRSNFRRILKKHDPPTSR